MQKEKLARSVSRRQFVKGVAAGSVIAGLEFARVRPLFGEAGFHTPPTLTGNHFELTVDKLPVNFTGKRSVATAVNGSVAGPTLRWSEGDAVTVGVTNHLKTPTSIHWHG